MYTIGIDDYTCYCTFRIPNIEYKVGSHNITFQAILNSEIRGSITTPFFVTNGKFILNATQFSEMSNLSCMLNHPIIQVHTCQHSYWLIT